METLVAPSHAHAFSLSRLALSNFRNYSTLEATLQQKPVVITGPNGSGKTNILEAISLLSPGKGLRRIKLSEADRIDNQTRLPWAIHATIGYHGQETHIGTGRHNISESKRIVKIDGTVIKNQTELTQSFSVMWQTPQMDGLFLGSASDRRKFLDRLVYNFDPEHASRIYSYEYSTRERAKLLQNNGDPRWISILEEKMAERAVSIAIARLDAIHSIQAAMLQSDTAFPKGTLAIQGEVEAMVGSAPALQIEETVRQKLYHARHQDKLTGRTGYGTHRSDFLVTHCEKHMPAAYCSTGEQKALLLSIILAEARAKAQWKNSVPVLLLDEVVAHLDATRRSSLYEELLHMGAQVWMTGTDVELFKELDGKAQFLSVQQGVVASSL